MYLTSDLKPNTDFTKIMNEVIFDDNLTHAEFRLWCRLLALPKGSAQVLVDTEDLARQFGVSATNFRNQRKSLREKGYLRIEKKRLVITIPEEGAKPKTVKLTKEQRLREDLRDIWNSFKPDSYTRQRNPLSLGQMDTLKIHAQHNNQPDLPQFLTSVLTGAKADDWWGTAKLTFDNLFGTGEPKQKKFNNVEKLLNLSTSRKAKAVTWNHDDDKCWINWFHSKKATEYTKVERFKVEDRMEAFLHNQDNPAAPDTIRVYQTHSGRPCLWTRDNEARFTPSALPTNA